MASPVASPLASQAASLTGSRLASLLATLLASVLDSIVASHAEIHNSQVERVRKDTIGQLSMQKFFFRGCEKQIGMDLMISSSLAFQF